MKKQTIVSLKKLLDGIFPLDQSITVTGITNDSRRVKPGDLFLATVGQHIDSRQFIPKAIEQGASAILYEAGELEIDLSETDIPVFAVPELHKMQGVLAARFYDQPSQSMACIGVTGTNGKTTVTQWIAQALGHAGFRCGLIGTLGVGFPEKLEPVGYTTPDPVLLQQSLASLLEEGADAVAMEVSSHALAQDRLNGVRFNVAVFTQLSRDHLDYHKTMKAYEAAKRKLFEWEGLHAAVINLDDPVGAKWAVKFGRQLPVITYSLEKPDALVFAELLVPTQTGFHLSLKTPWGDGEFEWPFLGRFNISNVLAVLGVLGHFEVPLHRSMKLLEQLTAIPGRMEQFGNEQTPQVIVDYAHTPDALEKALRALSSHCRGKMWCVVGCGGDRDVGKRPQMAAIADQYSDVVIVTNDNPRTESPKKIVDDMMVGFSRHKPIIEFDRASAIAMAISEASVDDMILVAGKGHETYQLIGNKQHPFSDVEEVKKQLAQIHKQRV